MPSTYGDRHPAQWWDLRDPLVKDHSKDAQIRAPVIAHEAARREHAGDEEHIDLAHVVEHEIRLVDRCQPPWRRAHAVSIGAAAHERPPPDTTRLTLVKSPVVV